MHRKCLQENRTCVKIFWNVLQTRNMEVFMAFLKVILEALFKMIVIGAVSFGGICLGKYLRKKKDEKDEK